MIDAHFTLQPSHPAWVFVTFTLAGVPPGPDDPDNDCVFTSNLGPYTLLLLNDDSTSLLFDRQAVAFDLTTNAFPKAGVFRLLAMGVGREQFTELAVSPAVKAAMVQLEAMPFPPGPATGSPEDASLLLRATTSGATLTPFYDTTPLARLAGSTAAVQGFTLVLPDSTDRHILGVDAESMPLLNDDARRDIHRFLSKKGTP